MKFLDWLHAHGTVPNLLLILLLGLGFIVLVSATRISHFRLGDMIIDERGKASSSRISMFIALGLSSYMLAYLTINKTVSDETLLYVYVAYLLTWASSKTLDKFVSGWSAGRGAKLNDDSDSDRVPTHRSRFDRRDSNIGNHSRDSLDARPDQPVDYMSPNRSTSR
jgi:hypothetical protein